MTPEDLAAIPPARLPFPVTRAVSEAVDTEQTDAMPTLVGHFSTFDDWYEVDSFIEGHFLERVARSAFDRTIAENRASMKVLYDHGQDPQIGNKVLGPIEDLRTDSIGPAYKVPLFDTSYNRDLRPGLEAGVYGSSFRFTVEQDEWDRAPKATLYNPDALPERTITDAHVFEFGPVTFPANANATAGVRSTTDAFYTRTKDPEQYEELLRSAQAARTPPIIKETPVEQPTTIEEKRARFDELNDWITEQAKFPGKLPDEDQVRWDANVDERNKLGDEIKAYEERQRQVIDRNKAPDNTERGYVVPVERNQINRKSESELHSPTSRSTTLEGRVAEFRDDAKRILDRTSFPYNLTKRSDSGDRITDLLDHHDSPDGELARRIKYTSAPEYLSAFEKIIKAKGSTIGLTPEEARGTALAVGVDGTGGFTVPFAFDPTVIAIGSWSGAVNPYRRACRVVSIVGTDTWNALTATAVVATRTTEAAAATEQGPTFAQPQYVVKRVQGQITASFEMFQDRTDLAAEMATLIAEAKDNEEEASFATGTGSGTASIGVGPVQGTSGAFTNVDTAGAALVATDLDAAEAALPVRHRFNAQWFMPRGNLRLIQTLETTGGKLFGGNQYPAVGNPAVDGAGNTGLRLLGYPVNESPSLPTTVATNITIATLANVSQYVIVDRVGMSVQFIPFIINSSALATGQQALYFMYRNHAAPINVDGGRVLRYV